MRVEHCRPTHLFQLFSLVVLAFLLVSPVVNARSALTSFREENVEHQADNVKLLTQIEANQIAPRQTGTCWPFSFSPEQNNKLGTCCWYSSSSCCTSRYAGSIIPAIQRQLDRVWKNGTRGDCYTAIADLLCLWCHPQTASFLQGSLQHPELHICSSTCLKLWNACKDQQETFGIKPPAGTSRQFCAALLVEEEEEENTAETGVSVIFSSNNEHCFAGLSIGDVAASGCTGAKTSGGGGSMPKGLIVAMIVIPLLGVIAIAAAIALFAYYHKRRIEESDSAFSIPVDAFPTAEHLLGGDEEEEHEELGGGAGGASAQRKGKGKDNDDHNGDSLISIN